MALRKPYLESAVCPSRLGPGTTDQCRFKFGTPVRLILMMTTGADFFDGTTNTVTTEANWDTLLASDDTATPNNVLLTPRIQASQKAAGEENVIDYPTTGDAITTHYNDSVWTFTWADQTVINERTMLVSIRDNQTGLKMMYINEDGDLITAEDAAGNPTWIPVNHAAFRGRNATEGRAGTEDNTAVFRLREEVDANLIKTALTWDFLSKIQA